MRVKNDAEIAKKKLAIVQEAQRIIQDQGIDALSMRQLAEAMQLTPGSFYHYFKNKDELLSAVVFQGYQKILEVIARTKDDTLPCSEQLHAIFYAYGKEMLKQKALYQILMSSKISIISEQTVILSLENVSSRKSMQELCNLLDRGMQSKEFIDMDVLLTAQCLWCSVFGLLDRIIKEDCEAKQQDRLLSHQLNMMLRSIRRTK